MVLSEKLKAKKFNEHLESLKNNPINSTRINKQIIDGVKKKQKRSRNKPIDFLDEMVTIAEKIWPFKSPNVKYSHRDLLKHIFHFIETHVSWRKYLGLPGSPICGKYLNSIHLKYVRKGIYDAINLRFLEIYLENHKCAKLKFQSIDSSFVANKQGIHKTDENNNAITRVPKEILEEGNILSNPNLIHNNRYNGRKRYAKISHLVDKNGVTLSSHVFSGIEADCDSVENTIKNVKVQLNTAKYSNNNKYKQYLLADSGYDSQKVRQFLISKGYIPVIKPNNRNCHKKSKKEGKLKPSTLLHILDKDKKIIANVTFQGKYSDKSKIIIFRALKKKLGIKKKNYDQHTLINFNKSTENVPMFIVSRKLYSQKEKAKLRKLNIKEKRIYVNRQIVENSFAWLKNYPSLNQIYQKTIKSHNGLLQMANSMTLMKKIAKERECILINLR